MLKCGYSSMNVHLQVWLTSVVRIEAYTVGLFLARLVMRELGMAAVLYQKLLCDL